MPGNNLTMFFKRIFELHEPGPPLTEVQLQLNKYLPRSTLRQREEKQPTVTSQLQHLTHNLTAAAPHSKPPSIHNNKGMSCRAPQPSESSTTHLPNAHQAMSYSGATLST